MGIFDTEFRITLGSVADGNPDCLVQDSNQSRPTQQVKNQHVSKNTTINVQFTIHAKADGQHHDIKY